MLPGRAAAAGCTPLQCGPGQLLLSRGESLVVRATGPAGNVRVIDLTTGWTRWWLPPGVIGGRMLVHQDGTLLTWFDLLRGTRVGSRLLPLRGNYALAGSSQDGREAVLARTQRRETSFLVAPFVGKPRLVVLAGNAWSFDALAGDQLYLLQSLRRGYRVRLFDLATRTLDPKPLKDPGESALIAGIPWQRLASADGRYVFTLYLGGDGSAMIHQLDTRSASARCIDLPGSGDFNAAGTYAVALGRDGSTLWAISSGYKQIVAIDVRTHSVRERFSFDPGPHTQNPGIVVSDPHGPLLALSDAQHLWLINSVTREIRRLKPHIAIALAFSGRGSKLWTVGERSRVIAIDFRR